ncbi:hypothetical protein J6590_036469 [Homalodisca vitripennis]|nr:hypothetical protein J6590_036469 [Homalodisca vitripennis]
MEGLAFILPLKSNRAIPCSKRRLIYVYQVRYVKWLLSNCPGASDRAHGTVQHSRQCDIRHACPQLRCAASSLLPARPHPPRPPPRPLTQKTCADYGLVRVRKTGYRQSGANAGK